MCLTRIRGLSPFAKPVSALRSLPSVALSSDAVKAILLYHILKAAPRNSRIKPIDRTAFCIFSPTGWGHAQISYSVACCNQIHDCLLSKNSFRIGLPHEKSDVQRAAGGAQSELCGVALNRSEGFETSPVVIIWKIAVRIIRAMAIMARFFPLRLEICSYFKR